MLSLLKYNIEVIANGIKSTNCEVSASVILRALVAFSVGNRSTIFLWVTSESIKFIIYKHIIITPVNINMAFGTFHAIRLEHTPVMSEPENIMHVPDTGPNGSPPMFSDAFKRWIAMHNKVMGSLTISICSTAWVKYNWYSENTFQIRSSSSTWDMRPFKIPIINSMKKKSRIAALRYCPVRVSLSPFFVAEPHKIDNGIPHMLIIPATTENIISKVKSITSHGTYRPMNPPCFIKQIVALIYYKFMFLLR